MVISDTSPIVAFCKKGELSLLKILFTTIHLPKVVYDELVNEAGASQTQVESVRTAINEGWMLVVTPTSDKSVLVRYRLGSGEQGAIAACLENPESCLLLVDDRKAKQVAKDHHVRTLGTLGIMELVFKKRYRDKKHVVENIQHLLNENFYFSSDVIVRFFQMLDE